MKYLLILIFSTFCLSIIAQDTTNVYKKRVLESTEIDFLFSYYNQKGNNASVTGGIGTEKLSDYTPTFIVTTPLNEDDVLTVDVGISAYTSASSSNLNPFSSRASGNGDDDNDQDDDRVGQNTLTTGSPWVAASGASSKDTWFSINGAYSHSSNDRNTIWNTNISFASEYDYTSIGFGGGFAKLWNQKNTEFSIKGNVYLDTWNPQYPTEIKTYYKTDGNLNAGFFNEVEIWDETGDLMDKNGTEIWQPSNKGLLQNKGRNSYSTAFTLSQIINEKAQFSVFLDVVLQNGWLANPMQRVYFADKDNYFIGNPSSIPNYTSPDNRDVFMLADDIERLPDSRFKTPFGFRFNYYFNEIVVLRTYYRYYFDNWGIRSNTAQVELPIKLGTKFTLYPSYRFYNQSAADYFYPFDTATSTSKYYTSDYDLSKFNANQMGIGISYKDVFTKFKIFKFGLKNLDFKYHYYKRNTGLRANLFSFAVKFVAD